jgi:hypothetical protein
MSKELGKYISDKSRVKRIAELGGAALLTGGLVAGTTGCAGEVKYKAPDQIAFTSERDIRQTATILADFKYQIAGVAKDCTIRGIDTKTQISDGEPHAQLFVTTQEKKDCYKQGPDIADSITTTSEGYTSTIYTDDKKTGKQIGIFELNKLDDTKTLQKVNAQIDELCPDAGRTGIIIGDKTAGTIVLGQGNCLS